MQAQIRGSNSPSDGYLPQECVLFTLKRTQKKSDTLFPLLFSLNTRYVADSIYLRCALYKPLSTSSCSLKPRNSQSLHWASNLMDQKHRE